MTDRLLEMFFDVERWRMAIKKGIGKDIKDADLERLTTPQVRIAMKRAIESGCYEIAPPHVILIPKDKPGEFREVKCNEPIDRVFNSVACDLLFEITPQMEKSMLHRNCVSYQKGIGCGKVVVSLSENITESMENGWHAYKLDLSKYFDSVDAWCIDKAFDDVEAQFGHSTVVDVLRKYYHSDWLFDTDGNLVQRYTSLKQGCAVAAWLADVILYDMDARCSALDVLYVRYCDDIYVGGRDADVALSVINEELEKRGLHLNEKKKEALSADRWFKFLGFSIKGRMRSISPGRLKTFRKTVDECTFLSDDKTRTLAKCIHRVNRRLYVGDGRFSWATGVLPVINVDADIQTMNTYVMDAIRAAVTGRHRIGGLGCQTTQKDRVVQRGIGKRSHVARNRAELPTLDGYTTIKCMKNALHTCRDAYDQLVRGMM